MFLDSTIFQSYLFNNSSNEFISRLIGTKFPNIKDKLVNAYNQVHIGDPLDSKTLMGPLIDQGAVDDYSKAIKVGAFVIVVYRSIWLTSLKCPFEVYVPFF